MVDIFCRVVTIIVLFLLVLYMIGRIRQRSEQRKCEKINRQLTEEFILQFLVSREDKYGITRNMLEWAFFERKPSIPGCISYLSEILQKFVEAELVTIGLITVDEVIRLEGLEEKYDSSFARCVVEGNQVIRQLFGGPPNYLIRLTQHGRSLVKQAAR